MKTVLRRPRSLNRRFAASRLVPGYRHSFTTRRTTEKCNPRDRDQSFGDRGFVPDRVPYPEAFGRSANPKLDARRAPLRAICDRLSLTWW